MAHCVKTSADLVGPVKSRHFWTRKLVRPSARSSSLSRRNRWAKLLGACPACLRGSGAIPHLISNYATDQAEDEQGINALLETQQKVFDTLEKEYHEKVEALAASTKKKVREAESLKALRKREDRANKKALKKRRKLAKAKKRLG